jgi:23S rRNA (guanosine2251-2'-O)-methyltransferase
MEHLEGQQSVLAAVEACQRRIELILISHGAHADKIQPLLAAAEARGIPVKRVDRPELDAIAHGSSHGGVIAICSEKPRMNSAGLMELLDNLSGSPLLLLLEGIDDARNLGFTLRTAEAMGVHAVLIKKHLWDFDAVEIARPASGAYERLPLCQIDGVEILTALRRRGLSLLGCLANVKKSMYQADLTRPTILAIGGEKRGLSGAVREICDQFIAIPSIGGVTSLPLSHAAAIVLAEAMRQRSGGAREGG